MVYRLCSLFSWPLVPGQAEQSSPSRVSDFFTSAEVRVIPVGSVVLAYPYPRAGINSFDLTDPVDQAMLDQAAAGLRYKLVGGYGWWPQKGTPWASPTAPVLKPTSVETLFDPRFTDRCPTRTRYCPRTISPAMSGNSFVAITSARWLSCQSAGIRIL